MLRASRERWRGRLRSTLVSGVGTPVYRGVGASSADPLDMLLRRFPHAFLASALLALGGAAVFGAPAPTVPRMDAPPSTGDDVRWAEVRDVIEARCLECHGGERVKSGLRFANAETFAAGGDRGPVVVGRAGGAGTDFGGSRLLEVIRYGNPELAMPPSGELPLAERSLLERWVLAGAPWPEGPEGQLADPAAFAESAHPDDDGSEWWAYLPLVRPEVPRPRDVAWSEHPVDAFVAARREAAGLEAASPASPLQLLRRATFDLTGLPPSPEDQADFLEAIDARGFETAWSALLDRLLASPHYGEHQGRRWLDLVRYAETNGYERDATKTNIWRYRDWVIRSLNADKPYDRFVVEQLAGDELFPGEPDALSAEQAEALLATGYYRLGVWDDEPADRVQARADELADIVDTTGQVFLGTTMGCARCHDHKADPIRHRDYYAFTALFNNVRGYGGDEFSQALGGGMTRAVADRPGVGVFSPAERDARLARLDEELAALGARLGVASEDDERAPEVSLVADARSEAPATWRHTFDEPGDGWSASAFDDSAWLEGGGGFGTEGTPGARVGTRWDSEHVFLRTQFRLVDIPAAVALSIHHDEDVAVFLNGQLVFEASGYLTGYTEWQLDRESTLR